MSILQTGFRRRILTGMLGGLALISLSGCYPYYYDVHYDHGSGYYKDQYHGKRYYHGGHYGHRDRYKRERRKRYKYYRGW